MIKLWLLLFVLFVHWMGRLIGSESLEWIDDWCAVDICPKDKTIHAASSMPDSWQRRKLGSPLSSSGFHMFSYVFMFQIHPGNIKLEHPVDRQVLYQGGLHYDALQPLATWSYYLAQLEVGYTRAQISAEKWSRKMARNSSDKSLESPHLRNLRNEKPIDNHL